ncbi:hypothetical protein JCM3775_002655 [Rhodotorula graminis]|uniref:Gfo/Idh/MocA-like oxidoreductase N-terminal domain-containing protein n=1 Tax=Rhodotorula graminis (strain WP1) TaxID=578459 RepID=A0A0P9GIQ4_RHOGW|nr:uncharacterized protein RHOBADRAFT_55552 [Rhodotorula graminis WP1]KPV72882.1 hypothetical protein RHOBADRAFT_55552 [Rhodotorula graminis WP1]
MSPAPFKVVFVGAGEINFGSAEGPWNHSKRVESSFGQSLSVLGIVDPDSARAEKQIELKKAAGVPGYDKTAIWPTPELAGEALGADCAVDLVIVGAPPHFRGCAAPPADLDLRLLGALPKTKHWLVEKPVSAAQPSKLAGQSKVLEAYNASGAVVGCGYMMTALKGVDMIKKMIQDKGLTVMGTAARYYMAYEFATKPAWWNKVISCGPIVEQATHLASLSLLFGGAARLKSVRTHTVEHSDAPGKLSKLGFDEEATVQPECRIPRYTSAVWKYKAGAVGSLTHVVGLHGNTYDTEFEVICDGTTFRLVDMYTPTPRLFIRQSDQGAEVEVHAFANDDPFQTQIDRLLAGTPSCTYEQALQTYELTWAIREAGERERLEDQDE